MTYVEPDPAVARAKLQQAIDRANARAIEMSDSGIRPVLSRSEMARDNLSQLQRWTIPSRTTAGTYYNVTVIADCDGLRTECSCPAGQAEAPKPCWHRALARRATLHEAPYRDSRPTYNTVLVDADGNGTSPDPWDSEAFAAVI